MISDLEIAQSSQLKPITEVASELGIQEDELDLYGKNKAKIHLSILERLKDKPDGRYVDVTAITPTPLGEGKTVTTIGLSMSLNRIGKKSLCAIRQPSMGPTFGIKGGAAGGGYSQVVPMEDFNLHFTGDIHAVGAAHNLLAAFIDNSIHHGNPLNMDPFSISWPRVVDISDRSLRQTVIGLGGKSSGFPREASWDITVASEVMAILGLTTGLQDLRKRLGKIVVAFTRDKKPVTAEDLKAAGAMAVLLKDAIKPNLVQTLENTPALVHAGPFANIAHGNSSVLADRIGLKLADYVVTESGFGADIGAEKCFNIKCRNMRVKPCAAVLVATVRALKMHSGRFKVVAGKPLDPQLFETDPRSVEEGCGNLMKQIENVRIHGVPVVVAINRFDQDHEEELDVIRRKSEEAGAEAAVESHLWAQGGKGGEELARAVAEAVDKPCGFKFLYSLHWPIEKKVETIALRIYGARDVEYSPKARKQMKRYTELGWDKFPICVAKTHLSLSHDPKLKGRPEGFTVYVREIRASVGAGFLYPLLGTMTTMPGLPSEPAGQRIDIDEKGDVTGLS
ncbi:MAG TPA: formate--tetrahydrofolate ligase [bacterium]|nr:formate--tetrahydrofolate ligase [bacterium]